MASFRQACNEASPQTIQNALNPFFATWETNLTDSNLEKLESIAKYKHLSNLLETIIIHDDIEKLDPWNIRYIPTEDYPHTIWPRDETGRVITSEIGIERLTRMLRTRQLRPKMIKIRDYQATNSNFPSDPDRGEREAVYARDLIRARAPSGTAPASVAVMARDLVRDAAVSITSLSIGHVEWPIGEEREQYMLIANPVETISVGSPIVAEAMFLLSPHFEGQETDFSLLREAGLNLACQDAASYWLDQMFYKAPALRAIQLAVSPPCTSSLTASMVVPRFTKFELSRRSTSAEQILAMLACSRETLTRISLRSISLDESTWEEFLSLIAREFRALTSFDLMGLTGHGNRLDFHKAPEHIPREFEAGVSFRAKAPERRVMGMKYNGPNAAKFLGVLSGHVDMVTREDIEERRARALAESSEVVSTA